jgi:hypothetical protein
MTMIKNFGVALLCASGTTNAFLRPSPSTMTNPSVTSRTSSSALYSKNSDRARMERLLEESMGDDWKLFRAKLVAQEKAEAAATAKQSALSSDANSSLSTSSSSSAADHHPELSRNGQLGELFGSAISSIFNSKKNQEAATNAAKPQQLANSNNARDIFDGQSVGGANTNWIHPTEDPKYLGDLSSFYHQDPFCSTAELPIHIQPKKQCVVNKHRWAHEIDHIESGSVLIANEKLGGVFHQTVVLIVDHHKETGTTGIVINRYVVLHYITLFHCYYCWCCCCSSVVLMVTVWMESVRSAGPPVTDTKEQIVQPPPLSFSCGLHHVLFLSCLLDACLLGCSLFGPFPESQHSFRDPEHCTTNTHSTDLCKVIYSRLPRKFLKKPPIWICP